MTPATPPTIISVARSGEWSCPSSATGAGGGGRSGWPGFGAGFARRRGRGCPAAGAGVIWVGWSTAPLDGEAPAGVGGLGRGRRRRRSVGAPSPPRAAWASGRRRPAMPRRAGGSGSGGRRGGAATPGCAGWPGCAAGCCPGVAGGPGPAAAGRGSRRLRGGLAAPGVAAAAAGFAAAAAAAAAGGGRRGGALLGLGRHARLQVGVALGSAARPLAQALDLARLGEVQECQHGEPEHAGKAGVGAVVLDPVADVQCSEDGGGVSRHGRRSLGGIPEGRRLARRRQVRHTRREPRRVALEHQQPDLVEHRPRRPSGRAPRAPRGRSSRPASAAGARRG